jgi:regulator of replication initiation timing
MISRRPTAMPRKAHMAHDPDGSKTTGAPRAEAQLREALRRLQEENTALRRENAQLHQHLKTQEAWEHHTVQYQRAQTAGGAVVYVFTGTPTHYACPRCFSQHVLQCLQEQPAIPGTFTCPGCRASYPINPAARPTTPVGRKASLWSS